MNPQRTWRLLNFYSAGAVSETAVELTQNYSKVSRTGRTTVLREG